MITTYRIDTRRLAGWGYVERHLLERDKAIGIAKGIVRDAIEHDQMWPGVFAVRVVATNDTGFRTVWHESIPDPADSGGPE